MDFDVLFDVSLNKRLNRQSTCRSCDVIVMESISKYIHYNLWDKIPYPSPNLNAAKVFGLGNFFDPTFTRAVITYPCWDESYSMLVMSLMACSLIPSYLYSFYVHLCLIKYGVAFLECTRWRHGREILSALLALFEGKTPLTGGFSFKKLHNAELLYYIRF